MSESIDSSVLICLGQMSDYESVFVFGTNRDVDSGSLPEDIWNGGGLYPGFPTGAPERVEVFSSDAGDAGTITIRGLLTSASTRYVTETIQMNGLTPVQSVNSYYRVNQGIYHTGSPLTFNLGTITCRHVTTTANIFFAMPIGRSITAVCAYTLPANCTGSLVWLRAQMGSAQPNDSLNAALWLRALGDSPILSAIFPISTTIPYVLDPYVGVRLSPGTDIVMRILEAQGNSIIVTGRMQLILNYH